MTGWLLVAAVARAAEAPAPAAASGTEAPAATSASSAGEIVGMGVTIQSPIQDIYSKNSWMVIEVDFSAKPAARSNLVNDVSVTLTLAWPNPSATPPVDLPLSATVHLIGVIAGKKNVAFFFVPPETLARAAKGLAYPAGTLPGYYAVQFKVGDSAQPVARGDYSNLFTNPDSAKSFISNIGSGAASKTLMLSEANVPPYILTQVLPKVSSNTLPTFLPGDSGH